MLTLFAVSILMVVCLILVCANAVDKENYPLAVIAGLFSILMSVLSGVTYIAHILLK